MFSFCSRTVGARARNALNIAAPRSQSTNFASLRFLSDDKWEPNIPEPKNETPGYLKARDGPVPEKLKKIQSDIEGYVRKDFLPLYPHGVQIRKLQRGIAFQMERKKRPGKLDYSEIMPILGIMERNKELQLDVNNGKVVIRPPDFAERLDKHRTIFEDFIREWLPSHKQGVRVQVLMKDIKKKIRGGMGHHEIMHNLERLANKQELVLEVQRGKVRIWPLPQYQKPAPNREIKYPTATKKSKDDRGKMKNEHPQHYF